MKYERDNGCSWAYRETLGDICGSHVTGTIYIIYMRASNL